MSVCGNARAGSPLYYIYNDYIAPGIFRTVPSRPLTNIPRVINYSALIPGPE